MHPTKRTFRGEEVRAPGNSLLGHDMKRMRDEAVSRARPGIPTRLADSSYRVTLDETSCERADKYALARLMMRRR